MSEDLLSALRRASVLLNTGSLRSHLCCCSVTNDLQLFFWLLPQMRLRVLYTPLRPLGAFMNSFIQQMPGPMLGENRDQWTQFQYLGKHADIWGDWILEQLVTS